MHLQCVLFITTTTKAFLINVVSRECDILRLFRYRLKTHLDIMHFKIHHISRDLCKSGCPKNSFCLHLTPAFQFRALQLPKWRSDDSGILLVTLQRHDSVRQKLEALMQTRALPKITCHKLSKTKFSVLFSLFFSQLKLSSFFPALISYIFRELSFWWLQRREGRMLWRCVGKDRFGTIRNLKSFVPLKMTRKE